MSLVIYLKEYVFDDTTGEKSFLNLHIHIYKQGMQLKYERYTMYIVPPQKSLYQSHFWGFRPSQADTFFY